MNVFLVCLNALLPLFIIMICGTLLRQGKLLKEKDVNQINGACFRCFLPLMLFYSIYSSDINTALNIGLICYSVVATLAVTGLCVLLIPRMEKNRECQSVMIQGIFRSNFALVGIPMAAELVKGADLAPAAMLIAVMIPLYNFLAVLILEAYAGEKFSFRHFALDIIKNPLIIASLLGILFLLLGIRLPGVIEKAAGDMSKIASPLSMLLLGASFRTDNLRPFAKELFIVSVGRLLLVPGAVLAIAYFIGFRGVEFAALIAMFAASTSASSFPMAQQLGGDSRLAGNIVICTSFLCPFTVYLWSVLYMNLGAF